MKKIILLTIAIAVSLYLLFSMLIVDTQINKYDTLQTAIEQNATQNGWIPEILPPSAYDIAETHDLDTNEIFGVFRYKEADEATLLSKLTLFGDDNQTTTWGDFLFHVDTAKNYVKFRNKPTSPRKTGKEK